MSRYIDAEKIEWHEQLEPLGNGKYEYCRVAYMGDIDAMPSAQPERILYANMSDAEFEKWLYEHGICHPNIHESIPCDAVPLLIDNAISELPSAQPDLQECEKCIFKPFKQFQTERKKGKWILVKGSNGKDYHKCSECLHTQDITGVKNYCAVCGANMKGDDNG